MTTDAFTTAARAEAERRWPKGTAPTSRVAERDAVSRLVFADAAEWARDHLAAEIRKAQADAWDACATELQDMGGEDARAMAYILMATNPHKEAN